jgi:hypothetical protein
VLIGSQEAELAGVASVVEDASDIEALPARRTGLYERRREWRCGAFRAVLACSGCSDVF